MSLGSVPQSLLSLRFNGNSVRVWIWLCEGGEGCGLTGFSTSKKSSRCPQVTGALQVSVAGAGGSCSVICSLALARPGGPPLQTRPHLCSHCYCYCLLLCILVWFCIWPLAYVVHAVTPVQKLPHCFFYDHHGRYLSATC